LVLLGLILLLAAGLRLTRLGLVEFKYDEATTARAALAIAHEGHFPAVGMISSQGPHNPPLMSYVLALPFALSRDPRLAAGWIALLGVAAVGMAYWLGRSYFNWRVGALAALLFAASPWAVFHSRKIWAENLPFLTLLFIAAVLALVVRRRPWALVGALAAAGGLVSLHLGGLAFFFILAVIMALFHRRIRPLPLLTGVAALALILSPYVIHDARHGWSDLRAFLSLGQSEGGVSLRAPGIAAMMIGGYHLEDLAGERHAEFVASVPDLRWLDQVEMALVWLGLAWLIWRVGREVVNRQKPLSRDGAARLVLLCWFAVPVILLVVKGGSVHLHTFNLLYPVQHLIIALFLSDLTDYVSRFTLHASRFTFYVSRFTICILLLSLIVWQVYFQEALLTFVDTHETPGGYGAPLTYALTAARRAERLLDETGSAALIALLPGGDPEHQGTAAAFDVLLPPENRRLVDGREALVLPDRPVVYLVHPQAEAAKSVLDGMATEVAPASALRGGSEAAYRFFHRPATAVDPAHTWDGDLSRWRSGARLLGYDWSGQLRPDGVLHWTLIWRVEGRPAPGSNFHWFNHLMDDDGARWGQKDGVGLPVPKWRVGDTVVTWFDIPIDPDAPAPPYVVRVGMYTYPDVVNVPLVDVAGNPAAPFVEIEVSEVSE
jgi:hypothetical protein